MLQGISTVTTLNEKRDNFFAPLIHQSTDGLFAKVDSSGDFPYSVVGVKSDDESRYACWCPYSGWKC